MPPGDQRWQQIDAKLPENDHARLVRRQVERLDRKIVDQVYRGVGEPAFDPLVLLGMVLYQYLKGRHSPATWVEEARVNEAMQWLGYGYTPARRTWYNFRDRIGSVIELLHVNLVQQAIEEGYLDPTTGAQDGTSIAACASRHRMVNRKTLAKRQQLLGDLINGTSVPSDPQLPQWVPPTSRGRLELYSRMTTSTEVLDQRIAENAAKTRDKRKNPDKIQVSLTDPIAPLGRDKRRTYRPLYTIQAMVDPVSLLIVSYSCDAVANDHGTLTPMVDKTQEIVDGRLKAVLADGGYCSILDLRDAQERNIDLIAPPSVSGSSSSRKSRSGETQIPRKEFLFDIDSNSYQCPQGHRLLHRWREKKVRADGRILYQSTYQCDAATCGACPQADQCLSGKGPRMIKRTDGEELLEAQREKMATEAAKTRYRLRGQTVELVFGDAKGNRRLERFHGRGLWRARCETGLLILALNILRLDNLQRNAQNPMKQTA